MVKLALIFRSREGRMMDALEISKPAQDQTGNVWKHLLTGIKASSFQSTWYLKGKLVFSLWNKRDEHLENGWVWRSQLYFTSASQSFRNSFNDITDAIGLSQDGQLLLFEKITFVHVVFLLLLFFVCFKSLKTWSAPSCMPLYSHVLIFNTLKR